MNPQRVIPMARWEFIILFGTRISVVELMKMLCAQFRISKFIRVNALRAIISSS